MLVCFRGSISAISVRSGHRAGTALIASLLLVLVLASGASLAQQTQDYLLGPEDVVTVHVVGHPEYSGDFLTPTDGIIDFPGAGALKATGKSLGDLRQEVVLNLKKKLKDPDISVTLKSPRPQVVHVLGEVGKPGTYPIKPGWRVTEVLSAAGGVANGILPADSSVSVLRASNGARETMPLPSVLSGDPANNVPVFAGDVVTLESIEQIPVYVVGKVRSPGLYKMRKDSAGVVEAIAVAGGSLQEAALSKVTITRLSGGVETVDLSPIMVDGKQPAPVKLQAGDLITVPESTLKIAVLGWVKQPGVYNLTETKTLTLSEAVGLAGGVDNKRGELRQIAVLRNVEGKQERKIVDMSKFLKSGDAAQNPAIKPGDVVWVPETTRPDWEMIFRALSTTALLITPLDKL